jgi:ribonucleoside-diphosphate reductase beta chain
MEGSAKIISLIARDENQHLALTQNILNKWKEGDDPEMQQIAKEEEEWVYAMFDRAVNEEKKWADYLFKDGSMIGLNEKLLSDYVEWIVNKRMVAVNLPSLFKTGANPLPWTQKWISGSEVQQAPQEVSITSYVLGGVKQDIKEDTFKGFDL